MSDFLARLCPIVVALVFSSACQHVGQKAPALPPQSEVLGEHGFSKEGLAAIEEMMETAIRDGRIPSGIAMLARDDQIIWLGTAGDMGPGIPMRDDAIIPLASVGKMYTAVAAMILSERRVISLDDPVSKYIPEFANVLVEVTDAAGKTSLVVPDTRVTIYHLLTHTGGLTVSGDSFWAAWNAHSGRTTTTDLARALAQLPLRSQPGERFEYGPTGASYEVLGAVIEIASGQTLEAFMTENIFGAPGLNDTYFYLPPGKSDRMPAFYRRVDGALQLDRAYGVDFPRTTFFHGGGGVRSSPQDILRFAQLFLNGGAVGGVRILRTESVRLMMTDHLGAMTPFRDGLSWGFGAAVLVTESGTPAQYGWVGGGYATLWVDLRERLVAYFAFPMMPPGDNALLNEFRRLVYAAMTGPKPNP
jgi:CubicO group peptidase (beta-lactamase class C family)